MEKLIGEFQSIFHSWANLVYPQRKTVFTIFKVFIFIKPMIRATDIQAIDEGIDLYCSCYIRNRLIVFWKSFLSHFWSRLKIKGCWYKSFNGSSIRIRGVAYMREFCLSLGPTRLSFQAKKWASPNRFPGNVWGINYLPHHSWE